MTRKQKTIQSADHEALIMDVLLYGLLIAASWVVIAMVVCKWKKIIANPKDARLKIEGFTTTQTDVNIALESEKFFPK